MCHLIRTGHWFRYIGFPVWKYGTTYSPYDKGRFRGDRLTTVPPKWYEYAQAKIDKQRKKGPRKRQNGKKKNAENKNINPEKQGGGCRQGRTRERERVYTE